MSRVLAVVVVVVAVTLVRMIPAVAQDTFPTTPAGIVDAVKKDILDKPDVLNDLLSRVSGSSSVARLLEDIDFEFIVFDGTGDDAAAQLGFKFDYEKTVQDWESGGSNPLMLDGNFYGRGNVAFDSEVNPTDFLDAGLKIHLSQVRISGKDFQPDTTLVDWANQEILRLATIDDEDELEKEWVAIEQEFFDPVLKSGGVDAYWTLSGHALIEANQRFTSKQLAYGGTGGLVLRSWNPDHVFSKFNLFDWPFALTRVLTGMDSTFSPSGRAFPSVLAGVDLVDPVDDEARMTVTADEDPYPRLRAEVALKTILGLIAGEEVTIAAAWRYYRELGVERVIEDAKLDEYSYLAVQLALTNGWNVRYTNGRLPFDQVDDEVWELGFTFDL